MSEMSSSLIVPINPELGGVLLANMLETWLDARADFLTTAEVTDELEDHRTASEQIRLHLCPPVDPGSNPSPSREHGTSVCPAAEGAGTGLERTHSPHPGPRFGNIGGTNDRAYGFQDLGGGCFDGASGSRVCIGSFTAGTLECRLVSIAGVVRTDPHAGDRRSSLSVFATTRKGVPFWILMKKYEARWPWCSDCFAKRAAPME